jgi:hybrid cluster-associated redox disulfide protein
MCYNAGKGGMKMIDQEMKIIDILNKYPNAVPVLQKNGVGCLGCMLAHSETIGEGLAAHGLDVETVLKEIESGTEVA